jgi:hypothetical protein
MFLSPALMSAFGNGAVNRAAAEPHIRGEAR